MLEWLVSVFVDDHRRGLTLIDASIIPFPVSAHLVKFDSDFVAILLIFIQSSTVYMHGERVGRIGYKGFVLIFVRRSISSTEELHELESKSEY